IDPSSFPIPRYWIHESHFMKKIKNYSFLIAFRDVARSIDIRTAILSIMPFTPCNHKIPIIISDTSNNVTIVNIMLNLASFAFDYVTRQKIGGTSLGFFILNQLPVLPPHTYKTNCQWHNQSTLGGW